MVSPWHSRAHAANVRSNCPRLWRRERHAERGHDSWNAPQCVERFHLTTEAAFDAADLVVQRLVAVDADGDDRARRTSSGNPFDAADDAVGLKAVGRESEESRAATIRVTIASKIVVDVAPQKDFAAREIDPVDVRVLPNERARSPRSSTRRSACAARCCRSCTCTGTSR